MPGARLGYIVVDIGSPPESEENFEEFLNNLHIHSSRLTAESLIEELYHQHTGGWSWEGQPTWTDVSHDAFKVDGIETRIMPVVIK